MSRVPGNLDGLGAVIDRVRKVESNIDRMATRSPNRQTLAGTVLGTLTVGAGATRLYNDTDTEWVIRSVRASVGTAPAGGSVTVDVNVNGTSIFAAGGQPVIPAGANTSSSVTALSIREVEPDSYLTVDIDTVGSITPGADLVVQVAVTP